MTHFQTELRNGTLILFLDRAPINALISEMLEEGAHMLRKVASDPPPGGLVITGNGSAFTAGVDTKIAAGLDRAGRRRLLNAVNSFAAALYRLPCAVVSAVNGHAIGAGGIICLASDWTVIANSPALRIGLPEAKAGLPFPQVPTIIMEHQLDPVWRRRLALSSMLLSASRAIEAGLADELCPPELLVDTAVARAGELDGQAGFREIKKDQRYRALEQVAQVADLG
jgi:enoyl-CoA hydratase/carnithine racemase